MYPFWEFPFFTSGLVIAVIASFHILPSHLATGAFWFNVYIERDAVRNGRPELFEFLKKFTLMILVFCFVIGSITGVGIWFSSSVASPRGISALIHNYVWGWATEWVFFIIEIATIYVYYYTMHRIDQESHLRMGIAYAWAAWISMIIITGILAFMLTSGRWMETGGFFDGFFNQTYWPQLLVRTSLMFAIAGMYAVIVASRMENRTVGVEIIRKASLWGISGMVCGALFTAWYLYRLPSGAKELSFGGALPYLTGLLYTSAGCFAVALFYFVFFGMIRPQMAGLYSGIIVLFVLFAGIGAGEGFREGVRRPYIISQYMYGNQLVAADVAAKNIREEISRFQNDGFIGHIYWTRGLDFKNPRDEEAAGRMIALYQCGNCHSMEPGGVIRSLPRLMAGMAPESPDDIAGFMDALGDYPFMPPFAGDDRDKQLIGKYLFPLAQGGN